MTSAVLLPLFTALMIENETAVQNGQMPTNIINFSYWCSFITVCGTGIALAITLAIFIAGKREENRAIAKLSLLPNMFNINETIVFGLPVVLNPPMCAGFIMAPMASCLISYSLTAIGFCPIMYINVPWTTPIVLSGSLASGGNIMGSVTQLICLAAATLIYIPASRPMRPTRIARMPRGKPCILVVRPFLPSPLAQRCRRAFCLVRHGKPRDMEQEHLLPGTPVTW